MGYLANFMVYTLAMIGVISIALLVFKNTSTFGGGAKSKNLKVVDSLTNTKKKTLYTKCTNTKTIIFGICRNYKF